MGYDPIEHGARCKECPLYGLPVVPPEGDPASQIAFVAQCPGKTEEISRRPLDPSAPSGRLYSLGLKTAGFDRAKVWTTNAVLCRPRNAMGGDADPPSQAVNACRPRLEKELQGKKVIVLMGGKAVQAAAPGAFTSWGGRERKITSISGYPVRLEHGALKGSLVLPIVHPAFILRAAGRGFTELFELTFKKAKRLLGTTGEVPDPPVETISTMGALMQLVFHVRCFKDTPLIVDVETTKDHPMQAMLKCIGVTCLCPTCLKESSYGQTWVIRWRKGDTLESSWTEKDLPAVTKLVRIILNT